MRAAALLCVCLIAVTACGDDGTTQALYPLTVVDATLETDDLGEGWTDGGFGDDEATDESPDDVFAPCGEEAGPDPFADAAREGSAQFVRQGQILAHGIGAFDTVEGAQQAFDRYTEAFDACDEWTETDEGSTTTFQAESIDVPDVGDETSGHRITGTAGGEAGPLGGQLIGEITMLRRSNVVITVAQLALGLFGTQASVDTAETIDALRAADEELDAVETVESL